MCFLHNWEKWQEIERLEIRKKAIRQPDSAYRLSAIRRGVQVGEDGEVKKGFWCQVGFHCDHAIREKDVAKQRHGIFVAVKPDYVPYDLLRCCRCGREYWHKRVYYDIM